MEDRARRLNDPAQGAYPLGTRDGLIAPYRDAVLTCITDPTIRRPGRDPGEWWHYLQDTGPSRWLKVVVAYDGDRGYVRTAFARRSFP